MNETNSHLPPVQGGNGLFVPITLEEMAKSPEESQMTNAIPIARTAF